VKAATAYNLIEVRELIFPPESVTLTEIGDSDSAIENTEKSQSKESEQKTLSPKCSSELVQRVAKKGKHKGAEFLACSAFPRCRYVETPDV